MKKLQDIDLKQACRAFAVANTPLFLLRKLRQDSSVMEISRSFSPEAILKAIDVIFSQAPETLYDHVAPYAYLVALSKLSDGVHLRNALALRAPEQWNWFDYIRNVLIETYSPISHTTLWVPGKVEIANPSPDSIPTIQKRIIFTE